MLQVFRHVPGEARLGQERPILAPPEEFHLVWRCLGRNPVTLWEPVPPAGYRAMGTVATPALEVPSPNDVAVCARGSVRARSRVRQLCLAVGAPGGAAPPLARRSPARPALPVAALCTVRPGACCEATRLPALSTPLLPARHCQHPARVIAHFMRRV